MALGAELNAAAGERVALAALGSIASGLSAAGTTQATATALTRATNVVTTCAQLAGVRLPVCGAGDRIHVANNTAVNLLVYPPTGGSLSGRTANLGAVLAPNSAADFVSTDGTSYTVLL